LLTRANLSALEMSIAHIIKHYTNVVMYITDQLHSKIFQANMILMPWCQTWTVNKFFWWQKTTATDGKTI